MTTSLDTRTLPDGPHQLAVNVTFADGGSAIAAWTVTVANAAGAILTPSTGLVHGGRRRSRRLPPPPPRCSAAPKRTLYRAVAPAQAVSIKQLDAALVGYLGLGDAARAIQATLKQAGLNPPANTGSEAVARMLELRLNHPAGQDELELRPYQAATRAEAAWSFAQVLQARQLGDRPRAQRRRVVHAADPDELAANAADDRDPLRRLPVRLGRHEPGDPGFDCSGFVWRVVKLTPYAGEGGLANVLRGRTTYQMSGEVLARQAAAGDGAPAGRRDVLRLARPQLEAERGRPHGALSRQRLVRPVERRRRDPAAVRRLVHPQLRLGADGRCAKPASVSRPLSGCFGGPQNADRCR